MPKPLKNSPLTSTFNRNVSVSFVKYVFSFWLFLSISIVVQAQRIEWPNGAKAAICLTYDDGMHSQVEQAIPVLNASGLTGTFFLNSITDVRLAEQWRQAAKRGHELANHTLFHPCLAAKGWKNGLWTITHWNDCLKKSSR